MAANSVLNPSKFKNRKVIVVDELFDNGNTINAVKDKIVSDLLIPSSHVFTCSLLRKDKATDRAPLGLITASFFLLSTEHDLTLS